MYMLCPVVQVEATFFQKAEYLSVNFVQVSESVDFEILRGLTNSLLAAQKPDEVS